MNAEENYSRRQSAYQMQTVMAIASFIGGILGLLALMNYGWMACIALLLLSSVAFGLSSVFSLLGSLFDRIRDLERAVQAATPPQSDKQT